ncbi:MAG: heme-binding protein [Candidatus Wallbacteria bacterium]|nr:heme-binding protein [Candidatus Wallbacteria bacterium]
MRYQTFSSRILIASSLLAVCLWIATGCSGGGGGSPETRLPRPPTGVAVPLTEAEVRVVLAQAVAEATRVGASLVVAVTNRDGVIRGEFRMTSMPAGPSYPGAVTGCLPFPGYDACSAGGVNCAVAKARTAAYFSSTGEAFSTRTARFIILDHFPPGVSNTGGGPLYGVNNSSLPGSDVLVAQLANSSTAVPPLLIEPNGLSAVDGGVPLYKGGFAVGGVGISSNRPELDEPIALAAQRGFAPNPLIQADQVLVDGIRLPYVSATLPPAPGALPALTPAVGDFPFEVTPDFSPVFPTRTLGGVPLEVRFPSVDAPGADPDRLRVADVDRIAGQAAAKAAITRGAIRRPLGSSAAVFVSVVDPQGDILGVFRTPDATLFSFDVSVQKARTAALFSTDPTPGPGDPVTLAALRQFRTAVGVADTQSVAITTRAIGFLCQNFFPPGIDGQPPGPLFGLQACLVLRPGTSTSATGDGITVFAGGVPLYRNGKLVGAVGVSGDGIDQDDIVADAGSTGFFPPVTVLKADQLFFNGARLPYVKFPRNPGGGVG